MIPAQLQAEQFRAYPPQARALAAQQLPLLRQLPLSFLPLLLRELIAYDWKFPVERQELDRQFAYLRARSAEQLQQTMQPFAGLRLSPDLEKLDWVGSPAAFSEQLTAHLWATHQIDQFRAAAVEYVQKLGTTAPPVPRLGLVLIGQGVAENSRPLFRKLRPHGVYFSRVQPERGRQMMRQALQARASAHPAPYAHWHLDGGRIEGGAGQGVTSVSYEALAPVRDGLLTKMRQAIQSHTVGPEALRSMLAQMQSKEDGVLPRFQLSLLTEGSGTQVFSTTFVQWAAREVWRRAQPLTLFARFTPRQREQSMQEALAGTPHTPVPDPAGSLVDADMGAYYTWINQQRLPGAENASFLVWFEDHAEALAIGPNLPRNKEDRTPVTVEQILARLA